MENLSLNYPEMHGYMEGDIQATFSPIMGKYRVTSKYELKTSKGVNFDGIVDEFGANNQPNKNKGFFKYYMTKKAFDMFVKNNKTVLNIYLD